MISEDDAKSENVKEESYDENDFAEVLDPRIQIELENLNSATDQINKLEIELDDARATFRQLFFEKSQKISELARKLEKWIEQARIYHDCLATSLKIQSETQKSALRFERATSAHAAARDMVLRAEEGMKKGTDGFNTMWQEMLNQATVKFNQAVNERNTSKLEHEQTSLEYYKIEQEVRQLYHKLKKPIAKSQPFFDLKNKLQQALEDQKHKIWRLEEKMLKIKLGYTSALHALEKISEEIHLQRKLRLSSSKPPPPKIYNELPDLIESSQATSTTAE